MITSEGSYFAYLFALFRSISSPVFTREFSYYSKLLIFWALPKRRNMTCTSCLPCACTSPKWNSPATATSQRPKASTLDKRWSIFVVTTTPQMNSMTDFVTQKSRYKDTPSKKVLGSFLVSFKISCCWDQCKQHRLSIEIKTFFMDRLVLSGWQRHKTSLWSKLL